MLSYFDVAVHSDQAEIARLLFSDTCHEVSSFYRFLLHSSLEFIAQLLWLTLISDKLRCVFFGTMSTPLSLSSHSLCLPVEWVVAMQELFLPVERPARQLVLLSLCEYKQSGFNRLNFHFILFSSRKIIFIRANICADGSWEMQLYCALNVCCIYRTISVNELITSVASCSW